MFWWTVIPFGIQVACFSLGRVNIDFGLILFVSMCCFGLFTENMN